MPVTFRPASQQWIESGDPEWTVNGWDMDVASVLWRGPRTGSDSFLASIVKFAGMPGFARMWLESYDKTNITPSFPGVQKRFIGFRDGNIPPQRRVNGTSSQVVTATGVDNAPSSPTFGLTLSGTFTYLASRTTWTWFETSTPAITARYNTVDQAIDPLSRLQNVAIQPAIGTDGQIIQPTYSSFVQIYNNLARELVVTDYEREELVPGTFWACRSQVEYRLRGS